MQDENGHSPQRLFGRRKGRPLRTRQMELMDTLLPRITVCLPEEGPLHPHALYDEVPSEIWMEIGFGGGEHLAAQAAAHPDIGLIGCEPFINGVAMLLGHVDGQGLRNVRVYPDDARRVLDAMPDGTLDRVFVLYADPWPKKRHAERRFIGPENLDRLARVMKSGAQLRLATDVAGLAAWMREHALAHKAFACLYDGPQAPADWVPTRYEQKGIAAGRTPEYMIFKRI
jgi:tRNA (guanine-N7-)-methyltransferase